MFQVGDKVWVEDSARDDIGTHAIWFIKAHPYARIAARFEKEGVQEANILYALEWDEVFPGGWDVFGTCKPGQGQQVTSKHLSLDFEGSRKVTTVPHLEGPMDY